MESPSLEMSREGDFFILPGQENSVSVLANPEALGSRFRHSRLSRSIQNSLESVARVLVFEGDYLLAAFSEAVWADKYCVVNAAVILAGSKDTVPNLNLALETSSVQLFCP